MRRALTLVLVLTLPCWAAALELVEDGGFESDPSPAWQAERVGAASAISRSTGYDGDPDFEVLAEKGTGNGYARLEQIVVVPSVDVAFAVTARIQVDATSGPWAAAGVALDYENSFGDILGTTVIVRTTVDCPWIDSGTFHMIQAPDEAWNGYGFNVAAELGNLAEVDPNAIRQIRVSLLAQVGGDC
jgi:hypothetical protein